MSRGHAPRACLTFRCPTSEAERVPGKASAIVASIVCRGDTLPRRKQSNPLVKSPKVRQLCSPYTPLPDIRTLQPNFGDFPGVCCLLTPPSVSPTDIAPRASLTFRCPTSEAERVSGKACPRTFISDKRRGRNAARDGAHKHPVTF